MRRFTKIYAVFASAHERLRPDCEAARTAIIRCRNFRGRQTDVVLNSIVMKVKRNLGARDHAFPKQQKDYRPKRLKEENDRAEVRWPS